jgi:hypothetical protein
MSGYNTTMSTNKCNTNRVSVYIRIALSLTVIALGIIMKNWLGVLGVLGLISAYTGNCSLSLRIPKRKNYSFDNPEEKS